MKDEDGMIVGEEELVIDTSDGRGTSQDCIQGQERKWRTIGWV